jgi:hypothetical protein
VAGRLSTAQVVEKLQRIGLSASESAVRADVRRGLVTPGLPQADRPGHGRAAAWTPAAVRRARYLGELRRLGVSGQTAPMLGFLFDGWGWPQALSVVQRGVVKSWLATQRSLNRPLRVRQPVDLDDNVDPGDPGETPPGIGYAVLRSARQFLVQGLWYGQPSAEVSLAPFLQAVAGANEVLGLNDDAAFAELLAVGERSRREVNLAAEDIPAWLRGLDADAVRRGRLMWWTQLAGLRQIGIKAGQVGSPRLAYFASRTELAVAARAGAARMTLTDLLAETVANAMFAAETLREIPLPRPAVGPRPAL